MRVLITGFNSFANVDTNPSQLVVEKIDTQKFLPEIQVTTRVLPTEYNSARDILQQLIATISPQIILLLGVAATRNVVSLERVALNLNDCSIPDNAGCTYQGKLIEKQGPLAYFATLPLQDLQEKLLQNGIATEISNHAGTYVCNHIFYLALHQIQQMQLDTACGFIHIPLVPADGCFVGIEQMSLQKLTYAIELSIRFLSESK
ncbi:pyroglutamyl-peptidase I [Candidatus Uabimicrobium amorphum]|uniref:Pyroglutamyl-peptidase I n=1 Tax=Uabimicrobium amorphum TaxID=2596890 RepID=A0A5S9IQC0_UABAM|nr:pyroglutamyl-peptidase I [Candidatus Uabimicrobium amorphum]BBM85511.1 pyrrolidone-carboxylate peptidase [Candidatus Uabimicrobium amorphum]